MAKTERASAINHVFVFLILGAILVAAFSGKMQQITDASFDAAKGAVTLAIGLVGIMALWLGLVRILEAGGLMFSLARAGKPLMARLFPEVPPEHPAMSAMMLNMSANLLGLGNAATPFGIKAMTELNKLNPLKGTATNPMCLFLAINTSSITLLPLGAIGVRAAANASDPAAIFIPTLAATLASTLVAIFTAKLFARMDRSYPALSQNNHKIESNERDQETAEEPKKTDYTHLLCSPHNFLRFYSRIFMSLFTIAICFKLWGIAVQDILNYKDSQALLFFAYLISSMLFLSLLCHFASTKIFSLLIFTSLALSCFAGYFTSTEVSKFFLQEFVSFWLMPMLMLLIIIYGIGRGVKVYEAVTEGAKQGFDIAIRIIPFLVTILVAIAMFRASGAMEFLAGLILPYTAPIGMPPETLPMALVRPLSGSGAFGVMSSIVNDAPDSYQAFVASTMMGSTETTFYVLAVYFGAVGITKIRHALVAALCADFTGIIVSCLACQAYWPLLQS